MKEPLTIKLPAGAKIALMFKSESTRDKFMKHLKDENIVAINKMVKRGSVIRVK